MIFIKTKNLNLNVPSKNNLHQWTEWVNGPKVRATVFSTLIPKTIEMQWDWIQNELNSKKRILLEICDNIDNNFLGVVSLSLIDFQKSSAQISTISPVKKNKKNKYCVYEARRALLKYAFEELSINKVYAGTVYPDNKAYMVKNMCLGFEIEGIEHDSVWYNNQTKLSLCYFMTRSIFKKKKIMKKKIEDLFTKKNLMINEKKLLNIVSFLKVK
jgi:RimJ/RimL family protein N-acetyltransferase